MSALQPVGEYEASLKKRYADARARLWAVPAETPMLPAPEPKPPAISRYRKTVMNAAKPVVVVVKPHPIPASGTLRFPMTEERRVRLIIAAVCFKYGLTLFEIMARRRIKSIVLARQEAMWRVTQKTPLSLPKIGKYFNGRDHTTVLYSIRRHQKRIDRGEA